MNSETTQPKPKEVHHGKNAKCLREIMDMKQGILAEELGLSQQSVSRIENQEVLDDDLLDKIAKALKVPVEAIKNFDKEAFINVINNTFNSNDNSTMNAINHNCNLHSLDKITELYERMLKVEQEKNVLLEKLLKIDERSDL